jgi:hypothetical protein
MRKTPPTRRFLPAAAALAIPLVLAAGGVARAALTPFNAEQPRWGAIYASPTAAGFGMTVGLADREAARRAAEGECRRRGARCRLIAEFAERCAAVAQGIERRAVGRSRTRHELYVTSTAAGAGRTEEEAENAALDACEAQDRRGVCLIAAVSCGGASLARF